MTDFVHLHLHSEYSLLDGGNRVDRLIARVQELGMDAVALTDHGNLHGAVEFYTAAKAAGVKPILGIEAYVAADLAGQPSDRTQRQFTGVSDGGFHLVLLAENQIGWQNLIKLSSDAFIRGFYYRPRMDKSTLAQWSDGLIAINGHLGSSIAHHLERFLHSKDPRHWQAAATEAAWHAQTFKPDDQGRPRFYLEIQRHGQPEQDAINPLVLKLAEELHLPVVADNDAHFLLADDHDAHDTLVCVSTGKLKSDDNRLRYSPELYVKSPRQMAEVFADVPQAIANTRAIADRCDVKLDFSANHAPAVKIACHPDPEGLAQFPAGSSDWLRAFCEQYTLEPFDALRDRAASAAIKADCDAALRALTEAGALWRYGPAGVTDAIRQRMERELVVLADKNIAAYFLIVWDFVNEARKRNIPVNARGSGVGTMVGYCLGLSNACPVKYGLLFERFADPDRSEYPDMDIDLCQDGRAAIIDYVRQKYGHVAQIITFGTLKARAAVRDVGRVLNIPLVTVDKVCKLIGGTLNMTLQKALDQEPQLKDLYEADPAVRQMLDTARKLEGHARHAGVHAAGVVIATQPLDNIVPLYQPAGTDQLVTQWDGPTIGKVGLLKMDFLGLRTLSIIERARQLIRQSLPPDVIRQTVAPRSPAPQASSPKPQAPPPDPLDVDRLEYNDPAVFALFGRGETAGVFQFESGGMRNLLMAMKPERLEDLMAANALYRPGPMAFIDDYNNRKHGRQTVPAVHPIVDRHTAETYGIMVYQEQVMQIVHDLGGIPLRAVYTLIKAISKKSRSIIDSNRVKFLEGAAAQGLKPSDAQRLWDMILQFAGYGFNKSHSTGYAILAYQTAYLKTYFPVQYMAAVLTYESVNTDKVVEYIDACRHVLLPDVPGNPALDHSLPGERGIDVRPPDINLSDAGFTVVFDEGEPRDAAHGHIRFGLAAVKGVGEKAVAAIVAARQPENGGPFKSLYDFCERVPAGAGLPGAATRATVEPLIKCGAFDCLHAPGSRAALLEVLDSAMQAGQRAAADRAAGQLNFFDGLSAAPAGGTPAASPILEIKLPNVPPWSRLDQGKHEKEVLGFYWTDPLHEHRDTLDRFANTTLADVRALPAETAVVVGGMLTRVRSTLTKTGRSAGQKMAMLTLSDGNDSIDAVAFAETYAQYSPLLQPDSVVFLRGRVDRRREEPSIIVEAAIAAPAATQELTRTVLISLIAPNDPSPSGASGGRKPLNGELAKLKTLLTQSRHHNGGTASSSAGGPAEVLVEVHQAGQIVQLRLKGLFVAVDADLPARVQTILGPAGRCTLLGPAKLHVDRASAPPPAEPDLPMFADSAETCASIDRY